MENDFENINKKINLQNKDIEEALANINTQHSSIITIANNIKNFKKDVELLEKKLNNSFKEAIENKYDLINIEINSQKDKIRQNNITMNDNINDKNNKLYLDIIKKIEENKKYFENHNDEIDGTISSINNNISELTTIIKTHPILNMNNNEIITQKFKENQVKYNEAFKQNLEEIYSEIQKLKQNSKVIDLNSKNIFLCQENFSKIKEELKKFNEFSINFKQIDENIENLKLDIQQKYDDNLKNKDAFNELLNKNINELNDKINCLEGQMTINSGLQNKGSNIDLEQFNEINKNLKKLENDLNNINQQKIPELLNIIDEKIKNQKIIPISNDKSPIYDIREEKNKISNNDENEEGVIFSGSRRRRGGTKIQQNSNNFNIEKKEINSQNNKNMNNINVSENNNIINEVKLFMQDKKKDKNNNYEYNNNYNDNEDNNYIENNNDNYEENIDNNNFNDNYDKNYNDYNLNHSGQFNGNNNKQNSSRQFNDNYYKNEFENEYEDEYNDINKNGNENGNNYSNYSNNSHKSNNNNFQIKDETDEMIENILNDNKKQNNIELDNNNEDWD